MKKKRLIPILLLKNGWLVQSKGFVEHKNLGNPVTAVERHSSWSADELIYLDITRSGEYDRRRDDLNDYNRDNFLDIVSDVAKVAFMPITVGGQIRTLKDIEERLKRGADKIAINTIAFKDRGFINRASKEFGSQCIVVSIDVKGANDEVFINGGTERTHQNVVSWSKFVESEGAGEIFLNSVDRDGKKTGYDLTLIEKVVNSVRIPVIACGGVGEWQDFSDALEKTSVDAVSAANIFHYTDQSLYLAKKYLFDKGLNVRPPDLL